MLKLIDRSKIFFTNLRKIEINKKKQKEFLEAFKKNHLIIIKWFWDYKRAFMSNILNNSNYCEDYLYINKNLDLNNIIKNPNYLEFLIMHYKDYSNKIPKIIVLDNFNKKEKMQDFINFAKTNNYKVIFIWNKIDFLENIKNKQIISINNKIEKFSNIINIENNNCILAESKNIITEEIIKSYNLNNIDLYNYTITFLSNFNKKASVREIHRKLNKIIKISLVTMIEYLKYSKEAKIINQVQVFDFKKQKEIETKSKYYFSSTIFRNSIYNFELDELLLKQNYLFTQLQAKWYQINSWINWTYEFDFFLTQSLLKRREVVTVYIDFCKNSDKKEIKKQINKLLKVPEKIEPLNPLVRGDMTQTFSKYLVLENPKELGLKKLQYENLKIVSLEELVDLI